MASSDGGQDPVDGAIRSAASGKALSDVPKMIKFVPFDSATKMSEATIGNPGGGTQRVVKGAYAAVIASGQRYEVHIAHASGTAANPMSDEAIQAKFLANAAPVIGLDRAKRACDYVWSLERQDDLRELIALAA